MRTSKAVSKVIKDICPYCKAERDYEFWYWAHCMEPLETTCDGCAKKYLSRNGHNYRLKKKGTIE